MNFIWDARSKSKWSGHRPIRNTDSKCTVRGRLCRHGGNTTRKTKTGANGRFSVGGCKPEKTPLSADAPGFATTTMQSRSNRKSQGPFRLTLMPGKILRLRVVDSRSNSIPKTYVFYDNMPHGDPQAAPRNQADFEARTDADGRVEWTNAPDEVLHFAIQKGEARRDDIELKPDGEEHVIALSTAPTPLTLVGSVTDAATGKLIPSFRVVVGWPTTNFLHYRRSRRTMEHP